MILENGLFVLITYWKGVLVLCFVFLSFFFLIEPSSVGNSAELCCFFTSCSSYHSLLMSSVALFLAHHHLTWMIWKPLPSVMFFFQGSDAPHVGEAGLPTGWWWSSSCGWTVGRAPLRSGPYARTARGVSTRRWWSQTWNRRRSISSWRTWWRK